MPSRSNLHFKFWHSDTGAQGWSSECPNVRK